jgi:hypothetical protein
MTISLSRDKQKNFILIPEEKKQNVQKKNTKHECEHHILDPKF